MEIKLLNEIIEPASDPVGRYEAAASHSAKQLGEGLRWTRQGTRRARAVAEQAGLLDYGQGVEDETARRVEDARRRDLAVGGSSEF